LITLSIIAPWACMLAGIAEATTALISSSLWAQGRLELIYLQMSSSSCVEQTAC